MTEHTRAPAHRSHDGSPSLNAALAGGRVQDVRRVLAMEHVQRHAAQALCRLSNSPDRDGVGGACWRALLKAAVAYNAVDALRRAITEGHVSLVRDLLRAGARPDARDVWQATPLMWVAARSQNIEVIGLLLAHGADPNAMDRDERTPLDHLIVEGRAGLLQQRAAVLQALLDAGATVSDRTVELSRQYGGPMEGLLQSTVDRRALEHAAAERTTAQEPPRWRSGARALWRRVTGSSRAPTVDPNAPIPSDRSDGVAEERSPKKRRM